jgi:hypothetical protein
LKDLDFDNDKIFIDLEKDIKEAIMKQIILKLRKIKEMKII